MIVWSKWLTGTVINLFLKNFSYIFLLSLLLYCKCNPHYYQSEALLQYAVHKIDRKYFFIWKGSMSCTEHIWKLKKLLSKYQIIGHIPSRLSCWQLLKISVNLGLKMVCTCANNLLNFVTISSFSCKIKFLSAFLPIFWFSWLHRPKPYNDTLCNMDLHWFGSFGVHYHINLLKLWIANILLAYQTKKQTIILMTIKLECDKGDPGHCCQILFFPSYFHPIKVFIRQQADCLHVCSSLYVIVSFFEITHCRYC